MFCEILENSFTKALCYYEGVIKPTTKGHSHYKTKPSQSTGLYVGGKQVRQQYQEKNKHTIKII